MAYGKIKADAIIYDNSGSDVEKAISSLGVPEGTAVKSTGVNNTTSYLRTDGDGTASWQPVPVPTNITVADESTDTTCSVLFTTAATGDVSPKSGTNLTFNSSSGALAATSFVGAVTGNVTGNASGSSGSCTGNAATATEATNITAVANNSTDETVYPVFVDGATGTQGIETDTGLTYNPSTGLLSTAAVTTTGNVIVGGNLTINGTTTTVNTATLDVEDKNIELGKVSSPSDTTADGGGITLKGTTDKTITWGNSSNAWTFNQHITVTSGELKVQGVEGGAATLYLVADEADDNADYWRIQNVAADNTLVFANYTTGGYTTTLKLNPNGALEDSKGDVRKIPNDTKTSAYVLVAGDSGKMIRITTGGITVNNSVFAEGDAVSIINQSGSDQTITAGAGFTLYNSADGSAGNRTLAGRGMATMIFAAADAAYISGAGLT